MRATVVLRFLAGCGQTNELVGPLEIVDAPLALEETSPLGFTAQEILDRAPSTTYDGALIADDPDFGPGTWSERLLDSAPFTLSALADPTAVYRQRYSEGALADEYVVVSGSLEIRSADNAFVLTGPMELWATDTNDTGIEWVASTEALDGTMPTWVDEAVADTSATWSADGSCAPTGPFASVRPYGTLSEAALILNIVLEPCGEGNYAWVDLTAVE